jgi:hypothetical protein
LLLYYSGKTVSFNKLTRGLYLTEHLPPQAPEGTPWSVEVPLEPVPGQWMMPSGNSVDRRTMMTVLNKLEHIYIKGAYGTDSDAQVCPGPNHPDLWSNKCGRYIQILLAVNIFRFYF